ncbi:hypothetical protein M0802_003735 [Mischocyttarus mexicanus]|nr:hypothetical protein M0802_003735 [Mischocyttarus mexicanus]
MERGTTGYLVVPGVPSAKSPANVWSVGRWGVPTPIPLCLLGFCFYFLAWDFALCGTLYAPDCERHRNALKSSPA